MGRSGAQSSGERWQEPMLPLTVGSGLLKDDERDVVMTSATSAELVHLVDEGVDHGLRALRSKVGEGFVDAFLAKFFALRVHGFVHAVRIEEEGVAGFELEFEIFGHALEDGSFVDPDGEPAAVAVTSGPWAGCTGTEVAWERRSEVR